MHFALIASDYGRASENDKTTIAMKHLPLIEARPSVTTAQTKLLVAVSKLPRDEKKNEIDFDSMLAFIGCPPPRAL